MKKAKTKERTATKAEREDTSRRVKAAKASASAIGAVSGEPVTIKAGDRVKILKGDYGNARGTVDSVNGTRVVVRLDAGQRSVNFPAFDAGNLARL